MKLAESVETKSRLFPGIEVNAKHAQQSNTATRGSADQLPQIHITTEEISHHHEQSAPNSYRHYRQTEDFLKHQKQLPPYPRSYSSHPANEIHMQVQGTPAAQKTR